MALIAYFYLLGQESDQLLNFSAFGHVQGTIVAVSVKLLVVDDDAGSLAALADILSMEEYLVETVANGQEALDHLRAADVLPALIILDLFMPVMDGWQFLAELKTDAKLSQFRIPVIVVTALNARVDADAVIRKPIDLVRLIQTVASLLRTTPGDAMT